MAEIKYNLDLLASAVVEKAYEDYRKYAKAAAKELETKGICRLYGGSAGDKLRLIQKDLLGDRMQMFISAVPLRLTAAELKSRFEEANPDIFRPLEEAGLITKG